MYQQDYILRQIEMLGTLLRRMLDAMREGRSGEAQQTIEEVFDQLGVGADLAEALPVEGLLAMLSAGGELDAGRAALLGAALVHRAVVLEAAGDAGRAEADRRRGQQLLDAAADGLDPDVAQALENLRVQGMGSSPERF